MEGGMNKNVLAIAAERQRQIEQEGYDAQHDDQPVGHAGGELALAAACYAAGGPIYCMRQNPDSLHFLDAWPWARVQDKRKKHTRRRQLEIAGALIVAELDRMDREEAALREEFGEDAVPDPHKARSKPDLGEGVQIRPVEPLAGEPLETDLRYRGEGPERPEVNPTRPPQDIAKEALFYRAQVWLKDIELRNLAGAPWKPDNSEVCLTVVTKEGASDMRDAPYLLWSLVLDGAQAAMDWKQLSEESCCWWRLNHHDAVEVVPLDHWTHQYGSGGPSRLRPVSQRVPHAGFRTGSVPVTVERLKNDLVRALAIIHDLWRQRDELSAEVSDLRKQLASAKAQHDQQREQNARLRDQQGRNLELETLFAEMTMYLNLLPDNDVHAWRSQVSKGFFRGHETWHVVRCQDRVEAARLADAIRNLRRLREKCFKAGAGGRAPSTSTSTSMATTDPDALRLAHEATKKDAHLEIAQDAIKRLKARLRSFESFQPTSEAVNALPEGLRRYIRDLETRCDPAGEVARLALVEDQNQQLQDEVERLKGKFAKEKAIRLKYQGVVYKLCNLVDAWTGAQPGSGRVTVEMLYDVVHWLLAGRKEGSRPAPDLKVAVRCGRPGCDQKLQAEFIATDDDRMNLSVEPCPYCEARGD